MMYKLHNLKKSKPSLTKTKSFNPPTDNRASRSNPSKHS